MQRSDLLSQPTKAQYVTLHGSRWEIVSLTHCVILTFYFSAHVQNTIQFICLFSDESLSQPMERMLFSPLFKTQGDFVNDEDVMRQRLAVILNNVEPNSCFQQLMEMKHFPHHCLSTHFQISGPGIGSYAIWGAVNLHCLIYSNWSTPPPSLLIQIHDVQ